MAIVINSTTGEIDLDQTTPGTYVVTYTVQGVSSTQDVTVNAVDNAGFSYSASSYEPTDADPTPTITGLTGGTFSGTTGLVINSTTGEIDLSASTVASHTITYNTSSSGSSVCPNTSTQTVEIAVAGIANNYSMNFDSASSDYIDTGAYLGDLISLSAPTSYTVSAWIKTTDTGGISKGVTGSASTSNGLNFTIYNGEITFGVTNTAIATTTNAGVNDGNWHHVVGTYNSQGDASGNTLYIYVDGVQKASNTGNRGVYPFNNYPLFIGARGQGTNASGYFNGSIDEVGIWNTALTSTQIAEIYNGTGTNTTKDLTTVSGSNLIYWNRMGD